MAAALLSARPPEEGYLLFDTVPGPDGELRHPECGILFFFAVAVVVMMTVPVFMPVFMPVSVLVLMFMLMPVLVLMFVFVLVTVLMFVLVLMLEFLFMTGFRSGLFHSAPRK